ncbi:MULTISPECIES: hypothetical protein [Cytobacillus]|jgi:hypothetical protein|nr:hypothetical protein [Cytobacillus oceanisediminis]
MMKRIENDFNPIELLQLGIYDTDRRLKHQVTQQDKGGLFNEKSF